jgi:type I restriction enzyme S subunit
MKTDRISRTEDYITTRAVGDGLSLVPAGSVLVVVRSGILRRKIPVAVTDAECTVNQDMKAFVLRDRDVLPEYVALLFRGFERELLRLTVKTGTTVESVAMDRLLKLRFPMPSPEQQAQLLAVVASGTEAIRAIRASEEAAQEARTRLRDHVFARLERRDASVRDLWRSLGDPMGMFLASVADIPAARKLVLRLAVTGGLGTSDPSDELPIEFLRELAASRGSSRGRITGSLEPDPALPRAWLRVPFGETHLNRDGERVPLSSREREGRRGGYAYYGASGAIDSINEYLFEGPMLLVSEDGANLRLRSTPVAFIADGRYWVNNHAHVLASPSSDSLRYLEIFINSIDLEPYLTGTAQPKLNQARMNSIPCPFPPLAEQTRIVSRVTQLMDRLDKLEAALRDVEAVEGRARVRALDVLLQ